MAVPEKPSKPSEGLFNKVEDIIEEEEKEKGIFLFKRFKCLPVLFKILGPFAIFLAKNNLKMP